MLTTRRRTGVTLGQQPLDAYGLEQMSGIFSSPCKPSPLKNMVVMEGVEKDDTAITPDQTVSARRLTHSTPHRPLRSSSPRKSGISGNARKNNGVDILSSRKEADHEDIQDRENTPVPIPTPIQDGPTPLPKSVQTGHKSQLERFNPSPQNSQSTQRITVSPRRLHMPRASLQMQQIEDEIAPFVEEGEFDAYEEAIQENEAAVQCHTDTPTSAGQAKPVATTPLQMPDPEALRDPGIAFDDNETEPDQELEQPAPTAPQNKANSRKKRKSDVVEQEEAESPRPAKVAKKRGRPPVLRDMTPLGSSPKHMSVKAKGKQPLRDRNPNLKLSSRRKKELENVVERVKARPGPPRSLYILRRETPADESATHTRSGRVSVKPLAYWRNEQCVYGPSPRGASLADGARFPLNSIKEIVRTEEVVESHGKKKSKGKGSRGKKGTVKAREGSVEEDEISESAFGSDDIPEDPDAEPWETETGTLRGNVSIWDNAEQAPTEQEEEIEIAHAPAAIKTREVKGSGLHDGPTFRYAKLLSTKFFGTGLVDLPPGGMKRPKNSRKMYMSFFVVKGRVSVTVSPLGGEDSGSINRFSIGKGGFWQVPRGESLCLYI